MVQVLFQIAAQNIAMGKNEIQFGAKKSVKEGIVVIVGGKRDG